MGGEVKRKLSATKRFIEQHTQCCFCAGLRPATTREHMPPKALFDGSHRPDKLVMPACDICNRGSSKADLIASLMARWASQMSDASLEDHGKLAQQFKKQAPEILDEWLGGEGDPRFARKARLHLRRHGVDVSIDDAIVSVGPATIRQLNLFAHKATLALYFEHFRRPLAGDTRYCASWRTKEDMALGMPEDMLKLLPSYATLQQGRWSTGDVFEYRYGVNLEDDLFGFFARLREGLFVWGFAMKQEHVPDEDVGWVQPGDLLQLLEAEWFASKC